ATSQDILDTALMILAREALETLRVDVNRGVVGLERFARDHRDTVCVARTLTQHAVPTTVGARAAGWARGVGRALERLVAVQAGLPAQLGGAGGNLASFVALSDSETAERLADEFAAES